MSENIGLIIFCIVILFCLFFVLMGITMLLMEKRRIHKRDQIITINKKTKPITKQELDDVLSRLDKLEQSMKEASNPYAHWIGYWKALFTACRKHNTTWQNREDLFQIAPPATEEEMASVEKKTWMCHPGKLQISAAQLFF